MMTNKHKEKTNISLIGMPGVGKSTVGVVLAKRMGLDFIDSDLEIQRQTGKFLYEIIKEQGLKGFIQVENRINSSINTDHSLIATGGSVIYGKEAMQHLHDISVIVYLKLSYESLQVRLGSLEERGVAIEKGQTLFGLYKERIPYYERYADLTILCEEKGISSIAKEIEEKVNPFFHPTIR